MYSCRVAISLVDDDIPEETRWNDASRKPGYLPDCSVGVAEVGGDSERGALRNKWFVCSCLG